MLRDLRQMFVPLGDADPFSVRFRTRVAQQVAIATALAAFVAGLGAAVRLLPLALDPALPAAAFAPFARSLFALAIEVALLLGISGGVASSLFGLGDRGDGGALRALGEAPLRTVFRSAVPVFPFLLLLGGASYLFGRDGGAPGRVLDEIVARGEQHCRVTERTTPTSKFPDPHAPAEPELGIHQAPHTVVLPFVPLVWLCAPGQAPRLAGRTPVGAVPLTARNAHFSGDLTRITLVDARLFFARRPGLEAPLDLHVNEFAIAGLPPWGHALVLPAAARAILLPIVAILGVLLVGRRLVARPLEGAFGRVIAIVVGLAPPLAAFGTLQALERTAAAPTTFLIAVPLVALLVAAVPLEATPELFVRARRRLEGRDAKRGAG